MNEEDFLTFLNAVNHFLAELITEFLYFLFVTWSADATVLCHMKMEAISEIWTTVICHLETDTTRIVIDLRILKERARLLWSTYLVPPEGFLSWNVGTFSFFWTVIKSQGLQRRRGVFETKLTQTRPIY